MVALEKENNPVITPIDTPEQIEICLHCSKVTCKYGRCEKISIGSAKAKRRLITHNGETHTISEWARILNIAPDALYQRLYKKDFDLGAVLEAFPFQRKTEVKRYEAFGLNLTIREWSEWCGRKKETLRERLKKMPPEEAFREAKNKII